MSKEYLPDQEKRILLSAISHEMRLVKENNFTELIPVVKNLDYKFMYDRLFKQIEKNAYEQGKKDAWEDIDKIINGMTNPIQTMKMVIEQMKGEQNE